MARSILLQAAVCLAIFAPGCYSPGAGGLQPRLAAVLVAGRPGHYIVALENGRSCISAVTVILKAPGVAADGVVLGRTVCGDPFEWDSWRDLFGHAGRVELAADGCDGRVRSLLLDVDNRPDSPASILLDRARPGMADGFLPRPVDTGAEVPAVVWLERGHGIDRPMLFAPASGGALRLGSEWSPFETVAASSVAASEGRLYAAFQTGHLRTGRTVVRLYAGDAPVGELPDMSEPRIVTGPGLDRPFWAAVSREPGTHRIVMGDADSVGQPWGELRATGSLFRYEMASGGPEVLAVWEEQEGSACRGRWALFQPGRMPHADGTWHTRTLVSAADICYLGGQPLFHGGPAIVANVGGELYLHHPLAGWGGVVQQTGDGRLLGVPVICRLPEGPRLLLLLEDGRETTVRTVDLHDGAEPTIVDVYRTERSILSPVAAAQGTDCRFGWLETADSVPARVALLDPASAPAAVRFFEPDGAEGMLDSLSLAVDGTGSSWTGLTVSAGGTWQPRLVRDGIDATPADFAGRTLEHLGSTRPDMQVRDDGGFDLVWASGRRIERLTIGADGVPGEPETADLSPLQPGAPTLVALSGGSGVVVEASGQRSVDLFRVGFPSETGPVSLTGGEGCGDLRSCEAVFVPLGGGQAIVYQRGLTGARSLCRVDVGTGIVDRPDCRGRDKVLSVTDHAAAFCGGDLWTLFVGRYAAGEYVLLAVAWPGGGDEPAGPLVVDYLAEPRGDLRLACAGGRPVAVWRRNRDVAAASLDEPTGWPRPVYTPAAWFAEGVRATGLPDGRLLVVWCESGGPAPATGSAVFDPVGEGWQPGPAPAPEGDYSCDAVFGEAGTLPDGRPYLLLADYDPGQDRDRLWLSVFDADGWLSTGSLTSKADLYPFAPRLRFGPVSGGLTHGGDGGRIAFRRF